MPPETNKTITLVYNLDSVTPASVQVPENDTFPEAIKRAILDGVLPLDAGRVVAFMTHVPTTFWATTVTFEKKVTQIVRLATEGEGPRYGRVFEV